MNILHRWRARRAVHQRLTEMVLYHNERPHRDWTRIGAYLK